MSYFRTDFLRRLGLLFRDIVVRVQRLEAIKKTHPDVYKTSLSLPSAEQEVFPHGNCATDSYLYTLLSSILQIFINFSDPHARWRDRLIPVDLPNAIDAQEFMASSACAFQLF